MCPDSMNDLILGRPTPRIRAASLIFTWHAPCLQMALLRGIPVFRYTLTFLKKCSFVEQNLNFCNKINKSSKNFLYAKTGPIILMWPQQSTHSWVDGIVIQKNTGQNNVLMVLKILF